MSLWMLASATVAVVLAAATGYRLVMLLACAYAVVIVALWFTTSVVTH